MKIRTTKIIKKAGAVLFSAACLFSLFTPYSKKVTGGERYECVWADGSVTEESFSSAYRDLAGMDGESVLLSRGGLKGRIASGAGEVYSVLDKGTLPQLLECTAAGTRIDGAALYRTYSKRVWYDGSYYVWTGEKVERVPKSAREEIVILEGNIPPRVLQETNASTIYLRAGALVKADTFAGSNVKKLFAEAPYSERDGAIYLDTAGGKRLVSAIGTEREMTIEEDSAFADEGALTACRNLVSLTLPFLGSALSSYGSGYRGEFAHLFASGGEFRVPATLERVKVTGGRIISFAFYGCANVKEIDACGVDAGEISRMAFAGMNSLQKLRSPQRDLILAGNFKSYTAECGCTVYERI